MNLVALFLIGVGTTALVSFLTVGYLKPHLKRILIDLCGTEERANFWTAFSNITLILVPFIFAIHYHPKTGPDTTTVFEVGTQLESALIGLVVSVVTLGIVIGRFIPMGPPTGPRPGS